MISILITIRGWSKILWPQHNWSDKPDKAHIGYPRNCQTGLRVTGVVITHVIISVVRDKTVDVAP